MQGRRLNAIPVISTSRINNGKELFVRCLLLLLLLIYLLLTTISGGGWARSNLIRFPVTHSPEIRI